MPDTDPMQRGKERRVSHGAHPNPQWRGPNGDLEDEDHHERQDDRRHIEGCKGNTEGVDVDAVRKDRRQHLRVRPPDDQGDRLEEQAQAHRRDDNREEARTDQPIEDEHVDGDAEQDHRRDHADQRDERAQVVLHAHREEEVRAEHHELALRKIHDAGGSEEDDEARTDECVQAPNDEDVLDQLAGERVNTHG
jgi:hypothetical protein